ncbi:hypothetical protein [Sphingobacterium psychroaquaticum]|uniref:Uncharacterized protein n=1 Tax=Sphingobacterium psychroaquaticum TaxID=561061 RepID=A0A1X7KI31_9SPHI|nr:hypothetical protein [Sphingobacterium psychroaquaticum]QBQ42742.1 hypothetical protein E2P86_16975 [Sphingobacterium psychroaquaticum]SMG40976.1 hypothetical protein SAMN05660862_2948 [Sphingobacterium psychroaquaticum]
MCKAIILSTNGATTVSYCKTCRTHYVWQNTYLLTFSLEQYNRFKSRVNDRVGKEDYYVFPDGEWRTVLKTPMDELLFTFTQLEWQDFCRTLQEASYMQEVYQLLN